MTGIVLGEMVVEILTVDALIGSVEISNLLCLFFCFPNIGAIELDGGISFYRCT